MCDMKQSYFAVGQTVSVLPPPPPGFSGEEREGGGSAMCNKTHLSLYLVPPHA